MLGQKAFLSAQLTPQPYRLFFGCKASQNGAGLNGTSYNGNQQTVEMHIASTDSFDDYEHSNGNGLKRRSSVHVTPPKHEAPLQIDLHKGTMSLQEAQADRAEIKAVKAELSMVDAELRAKSTELADSDRQLRAREAEVALLRAALTGRDISLRDAKAEAAEAQSQVQDKESQLQNAFEQLLTSTKERATLRQNLRAIQDELSETRMELENWTQKGFELNSDGTFDHPPGSGNGVSEKSTVDRDQVTKLLENLSILSKTIADDAQEDEDIMNQFVQ